MPTYLLSLRGILNKKSDLLLAHCDEIQIDSALVLEREREKKVPNRKLLLH